MSHLISLKWVYWYHWQQLQETLPLLPNLMKSFFWVYKYKGFLPENWPKKEKSARRGVGETMRRFYSPEMIFKGTTSSCACLQCGRPGFNPWVRKILWSTHSSTLAWKIPWTEEPGRLQSMGSQRVGHDWATSLSFTFTPSFISK